MRRTKHKNGVGDVTRRGNHAGKKALRYSTVVHQPKNRKVALKSSGDGGDSGDDVWSLVRLETGRRLARFGKALMPTKLNSIIRLVLPSNDLILHAFLFAALCRVA